MNLAKIIFGDITNMENFTPLASFMGGVLIGLAGIIFLYFNGKICGVSGIFGGLLTAAKNDTAWRVIFIAGLFTGSLCLPMLQGGEFAAPGQLDRSALAIIVAGLLVGVGARLGSGCTSGHGVCGVGRMAPRSIVATFLFVSAGVFTAVIVNHVFGGAV